MKKVLFGLLCPLLMLGCSEKSQDITLNFQVTDPTAKEITLVCHADIMTFPIDSTGSAVAVIKDIDAVYARLWYGRHNCRLYLEKGDKAAISFSGADFQSTFAFEGEKKEAVDYLNSVTLTALPDETYALGFDEYVEKLQTKRNNALKILKARDLKGCGNFAKMEEGRIMYAYATPLLMYPVGHMLMTQDQTYKPSEDYYQTIGSYFVDNSDYADLDEYRNFIVEAAHVLDKENRNEKDLRLKTAAQLQFITDRFSDPKTVATLVHYLAASYVNMYGVDGTEEIQTIHSTYVKDEAMIADFTAKCDKWNMSKPGRQSPDFEAMDIDGKTWTLADFKGKYLYIDMWATWCGPCKRELPSLIALAEKFSDAEITFLGLSTDGNKEAWETMIKKGNMPGVQLHIGPRSKFQKAYNIDGIPRFILIGKDGKIIENDMLRPSSTDIVSYLEGLEGIRK